MLKGKGECSIDVHEHYQKRSFRNRYQLLSSQGKMTLSIPLKQGKNNQQIIKDVKIAYDENWTKNHLETIRTCYGRSAYFEDYWPYFDHFMNRKEIYLYDFNFKSLQLSLRLLNWSITIHESESYVGRMAENTTPIKPYAQVFEEKFGFVEGLSIIDLLFTMGPEASLYL